MNYRSLYLLSLFEEVVKLRHNNENYKKQYINYKNQYLKYKYLYIKNLIEILILRSNGIFEIIKYYKNLIEICAYCKVRMNIATKTKDHIIPMSILKKLNLTAEQLNTISKYNILYCCKQCNRMKSDKTIYDFLLDDRRFISTNLETKTSSLVKQENKPNIVIKKISGDNVPLNSKQKEMLQNYFSKHNACCADYFPFKIKNIRLSCVVWNYFINKNINIMDVSKCQSNKC